MYLIPLLGSNKIAWRKIKMRMAHLKVTYGDFRGTPIVERELAEIDLIARAYIHGLNQEVEKVTYWRGFSMRPGLLTSYDVDQAKHFVERLSELSRELYFGQVEENPRKDLAERLLGIIRNLNECVIPPRAIRRTIARLYHLKQLRKDCKRILS